MYNLGKQTEVIQMSKIQKPIIMIRDAFAKLKFNPETKRIPKRALLRFIHFIEDIDDSRLDMIRFSLTLGHQDLL